METYSDKRLGILIFEDMETDNDGYLRKAFGYTSKMQDTRMQRRLSENFRQPG